MVFLSPPHYRPYAHQQQQHPHRDSGVVTRNDANNEECGVRNPKFIFKCRNVRSAHSIHPEDRRNKINASQCELQRLSPGYCRAFGAVSRPPRKRTVGCCLLPALWVALGRDLPRALTVYSKLGRPVPFFFLKLSIVVVDISGKFSGLVSVYFLHKFSVEQRFTFSTKTVYFLLYPWNFTPTRILHQNISKKVLGKINNRFPHLAPE